MLRQRVNVPDGLPFAPAPVERDDGFAGVGKAFGAMPAAVADAAAKQRAVCDRAAVKAATNKARTQMLSDMEDIANGDGVGAGARATDLVEKIRQRTGPAVSAVPERAGMYDYAASAMADTYTLLARRREVRGAQEADRAAVREENDIIITREVPALWQENGAASSGPDGEVLVDSDGTVLPPVNPGQETAKRALRARENARIISAAEGAPPEEQEAAADAAEVQVHMAAIGALTPDNPKAALEYLAQDEVKAVVPEADWKAAEARAQGIARRKDIATDAKASVAGMTPGEIVRKANTDARYKNNKTARKEFLTLTAEFAKQKETERKAERVDFVGRAEDAFAASGYQSIPQEAEGDSELYDSMIDFQSKFGAFQKEGAIPDENFLADLYSRTPEEIGDFLSTGANWRDFLFATAGNEDWKSAIVGKSKGQPGNPPGRFGGVDVAGMAEANLSALIGVEKADSRMKANVMQVFRERWKDDDIHAGVSKTERAKNILFDIIGEYRSGEIALDRPIYDTTMAARMQDAADNPVAESVNPATGQTEITMVQDGLAVTFEKVGLEPLRGLPGLSGASAAFRAPDDSPGGRYKGAAYSPGDTILTIPDRLHGMGESIIVLDKDLNPRWDQVVIGGVTNAAADAAAEQPATIAPPKTPKMESWENTHRTVFEWRDHEGRYVAKAKERNNPAQESYWQALPDGTISKIGPAE